MAKRRLKKVPRVGNASDSVAALRKTLAKLTKVELVDVLVDLAEGDRRLLRQFMDTLDVAAPPKELLAATRQAIADGTDFDERDMNRNFAYDCDAYLAVKRNLGQLIDQGQLRPAMQLSLELMKAGSYQVEMSDEGMMTGDIEDCLSVVIKALKRCDVPEDEVVKWCSEMQASDRVGFIAEKELHALRTHITASETK